MRLLQTLPALLALTASASPAVASARSPISERLQEFDVLFEGEGTGGTPRCASSLLLELKARWDELSRAERHRVELRTNPHYRAWIADGGLSWLDGDPAAAMQGRDTCFSPQAIDNGYGPYGTVDNSDHFRMHWSAGGGVSQNRADRLLEWFEESYEIETGDLGFSEPNLADTYQINVMVENLGGSGVGAYTSYFGCGSQYMPFIVVNSQWFEDLQILQSTAPHELFHAIQIVYGLDEFFFNQGRNEWWIEATAVYTETVVYPDLWEPEVGQGLRWAAEPYRSLETADDGGFQYGLWVFPKSVERSVETPEWYVDVWEGVEGRTGFELRDEFDDVLEGYGTDFEAEWRNFVRRGATMDYDWNPWLLGPFELEPYGYDDGGETVDPDDLPMLEAIDEDFEPEYLGVSYLRVPSDGIDDGEALRIRVRPDASEDGDEVRWVAGAVAYVEDDSGFGGTTLEPEAEHDFEFLPVEDDSGEVVEWFGEVVLNSFGDDYDGVILGVSPITDFGNGTMRWHYDLEIVPNVEDEGFSAAVEEGDDDDDDGGSSNGQGCASCDQGGAATSGLVALLPLVMRRRRR